jgi:hypothetical protein
MFGLLNSVISLASDAAKIVIAPVEMAADLAGAVVKPLAEVAKDLTADIKSLKD